MTSSMCSKMAATAEKAAEPTKEKEVKKDEEEEDSDDDMPELETAGAAGESKQSRAEKKSRKAMQKLGMKPVSGISRVTLKKSKTVRCFAFAGKAASRCRARPELSLGNALDTRPQVLFVIQKPEVFKSPASDTYIIFGEAKVEDMSQQLGANALSALQQQAAQAAEVKGAAPATTAATPASAPAATSPAAADNEVVDETGVEAKDIELVMSQTNATRAKAVKALKNHKNDIVEAIMVRHRDLSHMALLLLTATQELTVS